MIVFLQSFSNCSTCFYNVKHFLECETMLVYMSFKYRCSFSFLIYLRNGKKSIILAHFYNCVSSSTVCKLKTQIYMWGWCSPFLNTHSYVACRTFQEDSMFPVLHPHLKRPISTCRWYLFTRNVPSEYKMEVSKDKILNWLLRVFCCHLWLW